MDIHTIELIALWIAVLVWGFMNLQARRALVDWMPWIAVFILAIIVLPVHVR